MICMQEARAKKREKQEKNWFPSLFFSFHSATQYSLGANMGLSFFHHDTSMLYMELSANFVIIHLHIFTVIVYGPENDTCIKFWVLMVELIFKKSFCKFVIYIPNKNPVNPILPILPIRYSSTYLAGHDHGRTNHVSASVLFQNRNIGETFAFP